MAGQKVPEGYYHLDRMIESAVRHGAEVGCCGTCLDARGVTDELLVKGARRSSLEELTDWTLRGGPGHHVLSKNSCAQTGHG